MNFFLIFLKVGFMLIALIWKFDFSPFMVLIIAILNDGNTSNPLRNYHLMFSLVFKLLKKELVF